LKQALLRSRGYLLRLVDERSALEKSQRRGLLPKRKAMPTSIQAVVVIVLFLMPGFIASRILSYMYPSAAAASDTRLILNAVALSFVNYACLSWLLYLSWKDNWFDKTLVFIGVLLLSVLIFPILLSLGIIKIAETPSVRTFREAFGLPHPVPKAWDYFFRRRIPCWVIATLKSGRVVGGLYNTNSFASSYPSAEDLYLEQMCDMTPEGQMMRLTPLNVGAIMKRDDVELLEFFEYE
jgi:hypothetical protein